MNVIFLDFDGVIDTIHFSSDHDIENKIKILSDICHEYDCKIVIEASSKSAIDYDTLETESKWIKTIFELFHKYDIECIGRTPTIKKQITPLLTLPIWKEDEIRLYLFRHPEIEHYCIIDDDDLGEKNSDLNKVRDHLVKTIYYSKNQEEEGLLEIHKEEVGKILKKDNKIRNLVLKRKIK